MDLDVRWHAPVRLRRCHHDELLIYACDDLDRIPRAHGVYVFGRLFGDNVEPIYIGRAQDLRVRIEQHLLGNVPLMRAIEHRPNGQRVVLAGEWTARPGQREVRVLPLIEAALIKFALAEGYELVNTQGTRTAVHTLSMSGNRAACTRLFRSSMKIEV